jgi:type IV pilus assembly protein PilA
MKKQLQQGFTLIELMIVVAIIGILAAIAIPAYQDYVIRAQVSEGMTLMDGVKTTATEYYTNNGTWPTSGNTGFPAATAVVGNYVSGVSMAGTGVMTATFSGPKVNSQISGDTLSLSATVNAGSISWKCKAGATGTAVPSKYLPSVCQ